MRRSRLVLPSVALAVCLAVGAAAQPPAGAYRWEELQRQSRISAGTVLPPESGQTFHRLRIDGASTPTSATVLSIEAPRVSSTRYVVTGQVRYDDVVGTGYLEMWNYFPGGGQYFTRTLAADGPMKTLQGTSGWRPFALPFDATGGPQPIRLVVNVVLEGRGSVYLSDLVLMDQAQAAGLVADDQINRAAGLVGGIAGSVVGSVGALIGVLTALGRARRFVVALVVSLAVAGAAVCLVGIAALANGQSSATSSSRLLFGFLGSVLPLALLPTIRRRYQEIELRAMRAHDVA